MKQRGKTSSAAMSVVSELKDHRSPPPIELTEDQAQIWSDIVKTKPAEWFSKDSHELLSTYCCHVTSLRGLNKMLNEYLPAWMADDDGLRRFKELTTLRDKESNAMLRLARSMRLTQQARYDTTKAGVAHKATSKKKLWEG